MIAEVDTRITRRLFTRQEYHQMAEAGILLEDDRIELIHGEILQLPPIGKLYASITMQINALLIPKLFSESIEFITVDYLCSPSLATQVMQTASNIHHSISGLPTV